MGLIFPRRARYEEGTVGSEQESDQKKWWGDYELPLGRERSWQIGPLRLTVSHLRHEWQICRRFSDDPHLASVQVFDPTEQSPEPPTGTITRYATSAASPQLTLRPVLPDRSVVTRPERPVWILPSHQVTVFVGSPVWVRLESGGMPLGEFPAYPPKETWWGPNTREGELCYATRTYGRLRLEEAANYPHRVTTAVRIHNQHSEPLHVERLNLPVRRLTVFAASDQRLWTEAVALEHALDNQLAELRLESAPPAEAQHAKLLSLPRDNTKSSVLFRALGSLLR
jgi:hypothetical protein